MITGAVKTITVPHNYIKSFFYTPTPAKNEIKNPECQIKMMFTFIYDNTNQLDEEVIEKLSPSSKSKLSNIGYRLPEPKTMSDKLNQLKNTYPHDNIINNKVLFNEFQHKFMKLSYDILYNELSFEDKKKYIELVKSLIKCYAKHHPHPADLLELGVGLCNSYSEQLSVANDDTNKTITTYLSIIKSNIDENKLNSYNDYNAKPDFTKDSTQFDELNGALVYWLLTKKNVKINRLVSGNLKGFYTKHSKTLNLSLE
jgi:hypothetical protein